MAQTIKQAPGKPKKRPLEGQEEPETDGIEDAAHTRMIRSSLGRDTANNEIAALLEKLRDMSSLPNGARPMSMQEFALAMGYQGYLKRHYQMFGERSSLHRVEDDRADTVANKQASKPGKRPLPAASAHRDPDPSDTCFKQEHGAIGYAAFCQDTGRIPVQATRGRGAIKPGKRVKLEQEREAEEGGASVYLPPGKRATRSSGSMRSTAVDEGQVLKQVMANHCE